MLRECIRLCDFLCFLLEASIEENIREILFGWVRVLQKGFAILLLIMFLSALEGVACLIVLRAADSLS